MAGHTLPDGAIRTAVKAAVDGASLGVTFYNGAVPPGTNDVAYFTFHKSAGQLLSTKSRWGNSQIWVLNVWSKKRSTTQVDTLASGALAALTTTPLTITGFAFVQLILDSDGVFFDDELEAHHAVLSLRIETTGNTR